MARNAQMASKDLPLPDTQMVERGGSDPWLRPLSFPSVPEEQINRLDMDFAELTKIFIRRIQKLEPENFSKIVGSILLKEPGEHEMMQLAYGSDTNLLSVINEAKAMSSQAQSNPNFVDQFCSYPSSGLRQFSALTNFNVPYQYYIGPQLASDKNQIGSIEFLQGPCTDYAKHHYSLRNHSHFLDEQFETLSAMGSYDYPDTALRAVVSRAGRRSSGLPQRPCYYFFKGLCKNGKNCNYSHHQMFVDGYENEDHGLMPGSLEKLEMEITELLKSKRGHPISIASLPTLYSEKYGKCLQADGYLTESQRHGRAGYSLTKLLTRLNKIRVIERPHGQHSVVLVKDAAKYMECRGDPSSVSESSHQIYLTFPAESMFTEDDVGDYFRQYGPVRDVRIPCQDRRMFGFVSFHDPETVSTILMKRNPHYICGAKVLVKRYREKSRSFERTHTEKIKPVNCYPSRYIDVDPEIYAGDCGSSRLIKKQLIEEKMFVELERRRLSELRLAPATQIPFLSYNMEELKPLTDSKEFNSVDHFICALDEINTSQEQAGQASNICTDHESQIELPESPFGLALAGSSISAAV